MSPTSNSIKGSNSRRASKEFPKLSSQQLGKAQKPKPTPADVLFYKLTVGAPGDELPELPHKGPTATQEHSYKAVSHFGKLPVQDSALPELTPRRGAEAGIPALHTFLVAQAVAEDALVSNTSTTLESASSFSDGAKAKAVPRYAMPQNRKPIWSERDRPARTAAPTNPYKQKLDLARAKSATQSNLEGFAQRVSVNTTVEVSPGRSRVAPLIGMSKEPTGRRSDLAKLGPLPVPNKLSKVSQFWKLLLIVVLSWFLQQLMHSISTEHTCA